MLVVWLNYNDIDLLNKFQVGSNDRLVELEIKVGHNDKDVLDKF